MNISIYICVALLIVLFVMGICIFTECMETRKQMGAQTIAMAQIRDKMTPTNKPVFKTSIKDIKEYRAEIEIPMEHEYLVTEDEMKDALLHEMLPMLKEQVEVMSNPDFTTMKKKYLGRIKVVEVE